MRQVDYIATDEKDIGLITPLREKIRQYHVERSKYFKERITEKSIEEMNRQLLAKSTHGICLDLVRAVKSGVLVGYCLSNINEERQGEILSIYLEPEYRRQRIGYKLMERALAWMDKQGAKHKVLGIGAGNEEVVDFYRHFNFEIRSVIMEQVREDRE
jgi:ribosomal protein S18 acetylase RimI-like enzyme